MAYKKYNYRKALFGKKNKRRAQFAGNAMMVASKALQTANYVAGMLNVEKKYIDTISSGTTLAASPAGTVVLLNGCVLGDTATTREGVSLRAKSIVIEGFLVLNVASQDIIRLSIVRDDYHNGGALPSYSGSTTSNGIYDSASNGVIARRNISNDTRYKVLASKYFTLATGGKTLINFKMYVPLNFHQRFNTGNAGDATDIQTGALYFCFAGNLAASMSTINYTARYRFIDN